MQNIDFLNLQYIFLKLFQILHDREVIDFSFETLAWFWYWFKFGSAALSLLLIGGIFYTLIRLHKVRRDEREKYGSERATFSTAGMKNERWEHVTDLVSSENPNDWRQAIIEADIILDEMVTRLGYRGDGLGEKLKQIEESDFNTLNNAWEAHKVRNQIAHAGSDFILTKREARRVIDLFESVFREFEYI